MNGEMIGGHLDTVAAALSSVQRMVAMQRSTCVACLMDIGWLALMAGDDGRCG